MSKRRNYLFKIEQSLQGGGKLTFRSLGISQNNVEAMRLMNLTNKRNMEEQSPDQKRKLAKMMDLIADRSKTITTGIQSQMMMYGTKNKSGFG